jgi:hypothetical protein
MLLDQNAVCFGHLERTSQTHVIAAEVFMAVLVSFLVSCFSLIKQW